MELNHLRYFFEVAKSGSFTEAARRLHVSQSALSKAVALLEEGEGVKLFARNKKGVTLTRIGTEVFEKSCAIFEAVTDIQETCRGTQASCEGYLRFGASDHVINYLLMERVAAMVKAHPLVIPSVFNGGPNEICASILRNESEFGVFFTKINIPQLIYEPLMSIEMAVVCHPRWLKSPKSTFPALRKFIGEVGYVSSIGLQYQHHPSASLIGQLGGFPPVKFECNGQEAQKRFCREVGGVAYLARFMVEEELKSGELAEYPLPQKFHIDLLLARRRARPLSLNAQTYLDLFKT
jgi:DNA-binding transcriptional LysR family regulator